MPFSKPAQQKGMDPGFRRDDESGRGLIIGSVAIFKELSNFSSLQAEPGVYLYKLMLKIFKIGIT